MGKTRKKRWADEHGGFVGKVSGYRVSKINHRFYFTAWLHMRQINGPGNDIYQVYECRWGELPEIGETAKRHFHVGRSPVRFGKYEEVNDGDFSGESGRQDSLDVEVPPGSCTQG